MRQIRYTLLVLGLLTTSSPAVAQTQRAITQDGKTVNLYPDGTWTYAERTKGPRSATGSRPPQSTTLIEGKRVPYKLWIDGTKWKSKPRSEHEYEFSYVEGDGYAMVIAERLPIPRETLKQIVLSNAREAAPDVKILLEETRTVNGHEVLCLQLEGTLSGIPFEYYGYYYSGKQGTVQVITYTAKVFFEEYHQEFTDFLNGFTPE